MRFFFEISYLGTHYHGWQSQANATGIQEIIEKMLSTVLREKIAVVGSGRTDTGVHCVQQFFHADISRKFEASQLIVQLNSFLPDDIAIRTVRKVRDDANARYGAIKRTYAYHITRVKDPLLTGLAFFYQKDLDLPTMRKATSLLLGVHDFECFSKVKTDVNHFICNVSAARWNEKKGLLVFTITANRFLRGMVRAVIGTLLDVGTGKVSIPQFEAILKSRDRKKAGMNVPANGLYLMEVKYPPSVFVKH